LFATAEVWLDSREQVRSYGSMAGTMTPVPFCSGANTPGETLEDRPAGDPGEALKTGDRITATHHKAAIFVPALPSHKKKKACISASL
jgi:hypothetical protein